MSFFKTANRFLKLQYYNRVHQVNIKSLDVSLKAQLGSSIVIGARSAVDAHCLIGNHVYIGKNCNITKAEIGSYCSIANNVSIGQGEHHLDRVSTSSVLYEKSYNELTREACTIGHDVWIGSDAIILRGARIGNGAVIGANAVITKDVQNFEVVAGVPAQHIKFRFPEEMREKITESAWWDLDLEQARKVIQELGSSSSSARQAN